MIDLEISSIKYPVSSIDPEHATVSSISGMIDDKNLCNVRINSVHNS